MEGESSFRLGVWGSGGRSWAGQLHAGSVFLFLSEGFRGLFMWQRGSFRDSEGTVEEGWSCSGVSAVSILVCWVQCLSWKRSESGLHLSLLESDICFSLICVEPFSCRKLTCGGHTKKTTEEERLCCSAAAPCFFVCSISCRKGWSLRFHRQVVFKAHPQHTEGQTKM